MSFLLPFTWVSLPLVPVSVYSVHLSLPLAVRCVCPGMRLPCISVCWCVCVSLSLACVSLCVCVSLSGFLCVSVYFSVDVYFCVCVCLSGFLCVRILVWTCISVCVCV